MSNNWLGCSNSALLALALIGVWKFAGYYILFFLAGAEHPASTREAAIMEGATRGGSLRSPCRCCAPTLRLRHHHPALIYSITQIDHVVMTAAAAGQRHHRAALLHPESGVGYPHDLGKASAATFLTLAGLFAFSLLNLKLLEKGPTMSAEASPLVVRSPVAHPLARRAVARTVHSAC